jgi:hypothetical protein
LLSLSYGYVTRLTVGVPMTTMRFVIGLLVMAAATKADTMGVFITTQFQGIVGVSLASLFLMKRRENPFAAGGGGENAESGNAEKLKGKWGGRKHGAGSGSRIPDDGLPAAGVLAGLIEGAAEGPAKHGAGPVEYASHSTGQGVGEGPRDVGTGGTVRTLPIRTPKRIASWMPRRVRQQVMAEAARSAAESGVEEGQDKSGSESASAAANGSGVTKERPRQLAVPYRNYRRYRGA